MGSSRAGIRRRLGIGVAAILSCGLYAGQDAREAQAAALPVWATVASTGVPMNGDKLGSVKHTKTGVYKVMFTRSVSSCGYIASLSSVAGSLEAPGMVTTAQVAGKPKGVLVSTFDTHGAPADRSFALEVYCAVKSPWAVVSSAGSATRSGDGGKAIRLDVGSYQVTFKHSVHACGFNATVGGTAATSVPGQLITVSATAALPKSVLVRIQSADGIYHDAPFHLEATCGDAGIWGTLMPDGSWRGSSTLDTALPDGTGWLWFFFYPYVHTCAQVSTVGGWGDAGDFPHQAFTSTKPVEPEFGYQILVQSRDINGGFIDRGGYVNVLC